MSMHPKELPEYTFTDTYGRSTKIRTPFGTTKTQAAEAYMSSDLFLDAQVPPKQVSEYEAAKPWIAAARAEAGYDPEKEGIVDKLLGSVRGTAVAAQFSVDLVQSIVMSPMWLVGERKIGASFEGDEGMIQGFVKKTIPAPQGMGGKKLEQYFEYLPIGMFGALKIAAHGGKVTIAKGLEQLSPKGVSFLRKADDVEDVSAEATGLIQKGYKQMIDKVVSAKKKLIKDLGKTRVTMGGLVHDAVKAQRIHDPKLMNKAGIKGAYAKFKAEGSIGSMYELEIALKAKIPDVITSPAAKAYLQIKMALKKEYEIIEALSVTQTKLVKALNIAFNEASALKSYRAKTSALLSVFKDRQIVKQLAQGRLKGAEEEIVTKMTAGGKNKWGNIKAVMDALDTQGAAGNKVQRNLGLVYWRQQFEDIISKSARAAQADNRIYIEMADKMLTKIYAFGPKRMKELMKHAPDWHDMKELQRQLEAVARRDDPKFAVQMWRKIFKPGTETAKFPARLAQAIAIGQTYKMMGVIGGGGGQAQGNR